MQEIKEGGGGVGPEQKKKTTSVKVKDFDFFRTGRWVEGEKGSSHGTADWCRPEGGPRFFEEEERVDLQSIKSYWENHGWFKRSF